MLMRRRRTTKHVLAVSVLHDGAAGCWMPCTGHSCGTCEIGWGRRLLVPAVTRGNVRVKTARQQNLLPGWR